MLFKLSKALDEKGLSPKRKGRPKHETFYGLFHYTNIKLATMATTSYVLQWLQALSYSYLRVCPNHRLKNSGNQNFLGFLSKTYWSYGCLQRNTNIMHHTFSTKITHENI
jgi:hypothetical protein